MTDNVSPERRSEIMSRVGSRNTRPEMKVRSFLHREGLRCSLHDRDFPSTPDLVFPKYGVVLFVNACFWHGHRAKSCALSRTPMSNVASWKAKVDDNEGRDQRNVRQLATLD